MGEDDLVMLSVETGCYFSTNVVGRRLWELLETPRTIPDLRQAVCAEFDIDEATCEADIVDFVRELMGNGLIQSVEA